MKVGLFFFRGFFYVLRFQTRHQQLEQLEERSSFVQKMANAKNLLRLPILEKKLQVGVSIYLMRVEILPVFAKLEKDNSATQLDGQKIH